MKFPRKHLSDGWSHQNGILESLRHLQHSCLLDYPYICMWFVIPTARDSCHVVFFHVTFLICPAHQDVIPFWFDLDVFQNHVTFLICSGGESRSIQPIELDRFLGKRVRSYCRLPRRTRLCVCQRHVTCGIKKHSSWIRVCASKRYMEGVLRETPLFSLANRPGDLCIETKCLLKLSEYLQWETGLKNCRGFVVTGHCKFLCEFKTNVKWSFSEKRRCTRWLKKRKSSAKLKVNVGAHEDIVIDHCPCDQLSPRVSLLFCKINLRHDLKQRLKLMLKSTS